MNQSSRTLIVSREPSDLTLRYPLSEAGACQIETARSGWEALERVQAEAGPDLVLLEMTEGDGDALHTLRWLRRLRPELAVVVISRSTNSQQKAEALRLGARDYLAWPLEDRQLDRLIRRYASQRDDSDLEIAGENIEQVDEDMFFVCASSEMRHLRAQAELLAQSDAPVLVVGERDSGKEIVARLVHKLSVRSGFPFLKLNCSALPCELLETELFGQDRRVASGGTRSLPGKLETCDKGVLYLDQVTELPVTIQARLMRILQEKQFFRVGGETLVESNVRVMAASDANVEQALASGRLREDFYYRMSAFSVYVPPLQRRREDIPLLLGHFMNRMARHYDLQPRSFSSTMLRACTSYSWPGNLAELESFVKRYLVIGDEELAVKELERKSEAPPESYVAPKIRVMPASGTEGAESDGSGSGLKSLVQTIKGETERNAIVGALDQTQWNRKAAARLLKVSYRTLLYKIQQYHLVPPPSYLVGITPGTGVKSSGRGR